MTERRLRGTFATGAGRYDRLRPEHPLAAAAFLAPVTEGRALRVADVGAGTGKLTRPLLQLGHEVRAVEPSPAMREALVRTLPEVPVLPGTAEDTGLPAAAVDVATFGQSWHWVDAPAASRELARVLRPGGLASMLWTMLDHDEPWVAALEEAMHSTARAWRPGPAPREGWGVPPVGPFEGPQRHQVRWSTELTRDDVAALVTTRSYYLEAGEAERRRLRRRVDAVLERALPGEGARRVRLPYVTTCLRYRLSSPGPPPPAPPAAG